MFDPTFNLIWIRRTGLQCTDHPEGGFNPHSAEVRHIRIDTSGRGLRGGHERMQRVSESEVFFEFLLNPES